MEFFKSYWTIAFFVYYAIMIAIYEKTLIKLRPLISKKNEHLHAKYDAFRRNDTHIWTNRLLMYPTLWMFLPQFFLVCFGLTSIFIIAWILSFGMEFSKHTPIANFKPMRYWILRVSMSFLSKIVLWAICRVCWISHIKPKTDYKKWLGADWKPDYGHAGCTVANHQAF